MAATASRRRPKFPRSWAISQLGFATRRLTPETAFAAHRRLVDIHPFNGGNGRTARLLMNLLLIRGDYPPVAVRPQDRLRYLQALQEAQAGRGDEPFQRLLYERLDATLDEYLVALNNALPRPG